MKTLTKILLLPISLTTFFATSTAYADESKLNPAPALETTTSAVLPKPHSAWKATATSAYYSMRGTQEANGNSYSFGKVTVGIQTFGLEDQVLPDWKVNVRGQYISNSYELNAGGKTYQEDTQGLGDTLVGLAHPLYNANGLRVSADGGAYLPTGSTHEDNNFVSNAHYKYFLQLGSGTVDGTFGLTSLYLQPTYTAGMRFATIMRTGRNNDGYRLGDVNTAGAWFDVPAGYGLTPRVVANYRNRGAITGGDAKINRASAEYYYHNQVDWNASAALKYEIAFSNINLNAEFDVPFAQGMQNYDNVVISTNYYGSVGVSGQF